MWKEIEIIGKFSFLFFGMLSNKMKLLPILHVKAGQTMTKSHIVQRIHQQVPLYIFQNSYE